MAVQNPDIPITPYTSTVPVVSIPPDVIQAQTTPAGPLQGEFGKKGTGALAIGDAILKGVMLGHQQKEQRKAQQAEATITAADKATEAAYSQYQDTLSQAGGNVNDPKAQAAYEAYKGVFNQAKQAKAAFVIPQKPQKGQKNGGQSGQSGQGKGKTPPGFGGIKDFFEANPHIIPQIALMTMQPKPPGQTQESKAASTQQAISDQTVAEGNLKLAEQKRTQDAQKTYDLYSGLSEQQRATLPVDQQQAFQIAKNVLFPPRQTGTTREYVSPDGTQKAWAIPGEQPEGWQPTGGSGEAKPGTFGAYVSQYAKANGVTANDLSTEDYDYLRNRWQWDAAQNTATATTIKPGIDSTTTTANRTKGQPPQPPQGRVAAGQAQGGMAQPPNAQGASTPRSGGMTPTPSGQPSLNRARITMQTNNEKATRYQKAKGDYDATVLANQKNYKDDPAGLDKANKLAKDQYDQAAGEIEKWYNQQVHAIGGTVPSDLEVSLPNGQKVTFKNKQAADAFKKEAGIQ